MLPSVSVVTSNTVIRYNVPRGEPTTRFTAVSSMFKLVPKPAKSTGYGLRIVCVNTNVSKPMSSNVVPIEPGATCSLSPTGAAAEFLTARVR